MEGWRCYLTKDRCYNHPHILIPVCPHSWSDVTSSSLDTHYCPLSSGVLPFNTGCLQLLPSETLLLLWASSPRGAKEPRCGKWRSSIRRFCSLIKWTKHRRSVRGFCSNPCQAAAAEGHTTTTLSHQLFVFFLCVSEGHLSSLWDLLNQQWKHCHVSFNNIL